MYKETPLIKQYYNVKKKNPDSILFFQVGDFYEIFGYDAILCSRLLDITLTKRNKNSIYLAGFPCNSLIIYINKLIKHGYKIAICDQDQTINYNNNKNLINRQITNIISPGISLYDNINKQKNITKYIAFIYINKNNKYLGITLIDFSTGHLLTTEGKINYIKNIIGNYNPKEFFIQKSKLLFLKNKIFYSKKNIINLLDDHLFNYNFSYLKLLEHFKKNKIEDSKIKLMKYSIIVTGLSIYYIKKNYNLNLNHIDEINIIKKDLYLLLDENTIINLEIKKTIKKNGKSLLDILDYTSTSMGYRLLNNWLILPSKNYNIIKQRQKIINFFFKENKLNNNLQITILYNLKKICDIEKLVSKISNRTILPNQLYKLLKSFNYIKKILNLINIYNLLNLKKKKIVNIFIIYKILKKYIKKNPINNLKKTFIIKKNVSKKLDKYKIKLKKKKEILYKDYINKIRLKLKLNYLIINNNDLIGFYIEIKKKDKNIIPIHWIIKQRLSTSIRYTTPFLNKYEYYVYYLKKKIFLLEKKIYNKILDKLNENLFCIKNISNLIAKLDVLFSLYLSAKYNNYVKPKILKNYSNNLIYIFKGRHPVIEKTFNKKYIPNSIYIDNDINQILIITGPNMAGKSALLRQTALIIIMAQMGGYVPAKYVVFNIIDRIFSRIGASDNISLGESTFMLEMKETSYILNNISKNSLILMDEIGRGTSTYDGISLSYSIIKYLNNNKLKPKVLFTTHYYDLKKYLNNINGIKFYHFSIKRIFNKLKFERKLKKGFNNNSYGIYIAESSGIPKKIITDSKYFFNKLTTFNYINLFINNLIILFKYIKKKFINFLYKICDSSSIGRT
ncbi:MAG: DNA mismatch repair protein MutS [Candidatus Shikimatogenerans bostrichidophilus]|nr:MAG: DNA mismatch repair protein MutS [Candidatus Shikimatogenerans bostrichidophilus]